MMIIDGFHGKHPRKSGARRCDTIQTNMNHGSGETGRRMVQKIIKLTLLCFIRDISSYFKETCTVDNLNFALSQMDRASFESQRMNDGA